VALDPAVCGAVTVLYYDHARGVQVGCAVAAAPVFGFSSNLAPSFAWSILKVSVGDCEPSPIPERPA
jgi:hypothetical protein